MVVQEAAARVGWRGVPLGEVVRNFDSRRVPLSRRVRAERPGPYPYYGATGVMDHLDDYLFEGLHLLVGEDGSVETPAGTPFLQLVEGQFWVNNHAHVLRGADDDETRYLYYALSTVPVRPFMSGSVQAKLSQTNLNKIPVPYFTDAAERRAIVRVLGALDDRIELNRRMSETIEEMARALFRSWFVDFDPVRAKAEGRPSGLPPALDALFPASFEASELGEIPAGWEAKALGDAFRITMGQSPPGETYNQDGDGLPFYQGRTDFGFRFPRRRVYCTAPTRFAESGDSLVSVRAPVGDVNMAMEPCCVGRGVAAIRHLSGSRSYTYYSMRSLSETFGRFEAEGTVFGSIGKKDFHAMPWVVPPAEAVARFEALCLAMDSRIEANEGTTASLTTQRDALLPRFVSGALRIAP